MQLDPVCAQMEMAKVINFQLEVGKHVLRFNPKEQYKGELSLRSLTLPTISLKGEVKRSPRTKLPLVSLDLSIKQVNIDITTDVLNQLLIVQNSFIKVSTKFVMLKTFHFDYVNTNTHTHTTLGTE